MQPPEGAISTFMLTRPPPSVDDVLNGCVFRAANRLQQPLIENKLRALSGAGRGTDLMDLSTVMVGYGMTARGRGRGRCDLFRERRTRR